MSFDFSEIVIPMIVIYVLFVNKLNQIVHHYFLAVYFVAYAVYYFYCYRIVLQLINVVRINHFTSFLV